MYIYSNNTLFDHRSMLCDSMFLKRMSYCAGEVLILVSHCVI